MNPGELRLEFLEKAHDRAAFDCGAEEINQYLRTQARQDMEKGLSRTFVLVHRDFPSLILGYYTLVPGSLAFEEVPAEKRLSRYPAPVLLMAQLGVDRRYQSVGIGRFLLFDAIARAEWVSRQTGLYAIILDAREDTLIAYYEKHGFVRASGSDYPRRMYLKMSEARRLGLTPAPVMGSKKE